MRKSVAADFTCIEESYSKDCRTQDGNAECNYSAQHRQSDKGMVFLEPLKPKMASGASRMDLRDSGNTMPLARHLLSCAD